MLSCYYFLLEIKTHVFQNDHFFQVVVFGSLTILLFSLHESDRMWNTTDRVEESPRSKEEGGGDGGRGGFQVWVTVGRKRSRSC